MLDPKEVSVLVATKVSVLVVRVATVVGVTGNDVSVLVGSTDQVDVMVLACVAVLPDTIGANEVSVVVSNGKAAVAVVIVSVIVDVDSNLTDDSVLVDKSILPDVMVILCVDVVSDSMGVKEISVVVWICVKGMSVLVLNVLVGVASKVTDASVLVEILVQEGVRVSLCVAVLSDTARAAEVSVLVVIVIVSAGSDVIDSSVLVEITAQLNVVV